MTLADLYYEMLDMIAVTVILAGIAAILGLVTLTIQIIILVKLRKKQRPSYRQELHDFPITHQY